jgi:hypothetical protein
LHPEKVATPDAAVTGFVVHVSVPEPVLIARVTDAAFVVTTLLNASSTVTIGCCANAVPPFAAALGSVVKISCVAVPGVILNALLVAVVKPELAADNV